MNWKTLSTLILFCSLGWINSSKFYQNLGIVITSILLIYCLWLLSARKLRKVKFYSYLTILVIIPIMISTMNSYLLTKEFNITAEFIAKSLSQRDDDTKSAYYTEVIENIKTSFRTHPTTSFSMLIEIDRELNSEKLVASDFLNFLLSENINPFLPSMPYNPVNSKLYMVKFFFLILLPLNLAVFLITNRQKENIFYTLIFSCLVLSSIGIYFKYLYSSGLSIQDKEILGIWAAPEPRICFSSFSYKNHWSAYSLLILSTCFSMMIIISKKETFTLLRSNKFIFLITSVICIVFGIFYSNSNSGVILACLLIFIFLIISVFNKTGTKLYFLCIFFLISSILIYYLLTSNLYHRLESFITGESFRLHLWKDLLFQIQAKTFWGFGLESYQTLNGLFQSNEITSARLQNLQGAHQLYIPITVHAHSDFLQLVTELGFSGFCLFVFPVIFIILRNIISSDDPAFPYISYGLFIFLIYSIFDFPLRNHACLSMFIFLFSVCVLSSRKKFNHF